MRRLVNVTRDTVLAEHPQFAGDSAARRRGLLGRDTFDAGALILAPCSAIHTCFMRFAIDVLFVAPDGRVVSARERVAPWRIAARPGAFAAVELAAGAVSASGTRRGDILQLGDRTFSAAFRTF